MATHDPELGLEGQVSDDQLKTKAGEGPSIEQRWCYVQS